MNSALYVGEVMHHRLRPKPHRFVYRTFSLLVDLDELPGLDRRVGVEVGRIAVEPAEVALVDRLGVVADRPVEAAGVPLRGQGRR